MKLSSVLFPTTLLLALIHQSASANCTYSAGSSFTAVRDLGTLWIARDARIGSELASFTRAATRSQEGNQIRCEKSRNVPLYFEAQASVTRLFGNIALNSLAAREGNILQTNIPGIGAIVELWRPYNGDSMVGWTPINGSEAYPSVPFSAQTTGEWTIILPIATVENRITLIKTGELAPGSHVLAGELAAGYLTGLGKAWGLGLTGTINQAQCSFNGNPVSADPVQLGTWKKSEFPAQGSATAPIPFTITLSNCQTDADVATAYIRLDGTLGSAPIGNRNSGIFSLTNDSDASGVGIQILKADGLTPIALENDVPLQIITNGTTVLPFTARYYQTEDEVMPGLAKGALNFTISYQ